MSTTDWTGLSQLEESGSTNEARANELFDLHEALLKGVVKDRDENDSAGVSSPTNGDMYIVAASPTGDWSTENDLEVYINGSWQPVTPEDGVTYWLEDEDCYVRYDGALSAWIAIDKVVDAVTASTTQTQGQQPIDYGYTRVATCANANDVVTLPECHKGARVVLVNDGAQTLQYFPASSDNIDSGAADASATLAAGSSISLYGMDGAQWRTV